MKKDSVGAMGQGEGLRETSEMVLFELDFEMCIGFWAEKACKHPLPSVHGFSMAMQSGDLACYFQM